MYDVPSKCSLTNSCWSFASSTGPGGAADPEDIWFETDTNTFWRRNSADTAWEFVSTYNDGVLADLDSVAVGQIDAGAVGNSELGTAAVDTNEVVTDAITAAVQSHTTTTYNFSATATWETVMSQAVTVGSGESVMINATMEVQNPNISPTIPFRVRLRRGSTVLWTQSGTFESMAGLQARVKALAYLDAPSSGSHTYDVQFLVSNTGLDIEYRTLVLTRLKR